LRSTEPPTIVELEALLAEPDGPPIHILPDGSITGAGTQALPPLFEDGSNVFADPWRWLCLEWLLKRGCVFLRQDYQVGDADLAHAFYPHKAGYIVLGCPAAAEFPARALAALMAERCS
jgi:hypothetical protein